MPRPIKGFAEEDAFMWRQYLAYVQRRVVRNGIKRAANRREDRDV